MTLLESDIPVNGIALHIYRTNQQRPPLLFAHGITDNGLCFWPIAERFADAYEIVLYDSRNHGKSAAPQAPAHFVDRAHDLAGLITALNLQKPGLVGHSMGAATIILLAGLYPDLPGCIVLEDPPPFELMAAQDEQAVAHRKTMYAMIAENSKRSFAELVAQTRQENPSWWESERGPWAQSKKQYTPNKFGEKPIDPETGNRLMAQISCPTLLMTGEMARGALFSPGAADALAEKMANVTHVHIAGAGHGIRREQPEAFITAVHHFLQKFG
jgi:N-formylmaleamate deformylase